MSLFTRLVRLFSSPQPVPVMVRAPRTSKTQTQTQTQTKIDKARSNFLEKRAKCAEGSWGETQFLS